MMTLHLLARPLLARIVIDIAPDYTRRVYMSKVGASTQVEMTQLVEAVILGALEIAQRHGIQIKGFTVTPPPPPPDA